MWFDDECDDNDYPFDPERERDARDPYWRERDEEMGPW